MSKIEDLLNELTNNISNQGKFVECLKNLKVESKNCNKKDFNKFIELLEKDDNKILRSLSDDPNLYTMFKDLNRVLELHETNKNVDITDTEKSKSAQLHVTIGIFDQKKQKEIDKKAQDITRQIQDIKGQYGFYSNKMAGYIKYMFDNEEVMSSFCDKFWDQTKALLTPVEQQVFIECLKFKTPQKVSDLQVKLNNLTLDKNEDEIPTEASKDDIIEHYICHMNGEKLKLMVQNLAGKNDYTPELLCEDLKDITSEVFAENHNIFNKFGAEDKKEICDRIVNRFFNGLSKTNIGTKKQHYEIDSKTVYIDEEQKKSITDNITILYQQAKEMELQKQLEALGKELNEIKENYGKSEKLTLTQKAQIEEYEKRFSDIKNNIENLQQQLDQTTREKDQLALENSNMRNSVMALQGVVQRTPDNTKLVGDSQDTSHSDEALTMDDLNTSNGVLSADESNNIITSASNLIQSQSSENANLRDEIASLQEQLSEVKQQLQDKQNELSERLIAEEALDSNYKNQQKIIRSLELENKKITDQLDSTLDEFARLQKVADKSDDRKQRLKQAIKIGEELQKDFEAERQETEKLRAANAGQADQLEAAQTRVSELEAANAGQAGQLEETQQQNQLLMDENGKLKAANADQTHRINDLTGENEQLKATNAEQAETIASQADQFRSLNANLQGLNQNFQQAILDRNSVIAQNVALGEQNQQLQDQLEKQKGDYIRQIQQRDKTIIDLQKQESIYKQQITDARKRADNAEEARLRAVGESDELRAKLVKSESLNATLHKQNNATNGVRQSNVQLRGTTEAQRGQIEELQQKLAAEQQEKDKLKRTNAANQAMTQAVIKFLSNENEKSINTYTNDLMKAIGDNIVNCDTNTLEYCLNKLEGKIQLNDSLNKVCGKLKAASEIEIDDETKTKKLGVLNGFEKKLKEQEKKQASEQKAKENEFKDAKKAINEAVKGYCKNIEQNQGQENPEAEEQLINSIQNHINNCSVNGLKTALEPLKNIGGLGQDQYDGLIKGLNGIAKTISNEKKETIQKVVSGLENTKKTEQLQQKEQELQQVQQELAEVRDKLGKEQSTNAGQAETIETQKKQLQDKVQELQQKEQALKTATEQLKEQQQKIEAQQKEIDTQREKIEAQEKALTQAKEAQERLEKQLAEKQEEIKGLNTQLKASDVQIQKLMGDIKGIDDEKTKLAEQGRELAEQIKALSTTIEQTKQDNEKALASKQGEVDGLREELKSKQDNIKSLEVTNSSKSQAVAQQEEELERLRGELDKIQQEQQTKDEESQRLSEAKEKLAKDKESLETQLRDRQKEIDTLTEQNNAQGQQVTALQNKINELSQQYTQQSEQLQEQQRLAAENAQKAEAEKTAALAAAEQTYQQQAQDAEAANTAKLEEQKQTYEQRIKTLTEQDQQQIDAVRTAAEAANAAALKDERTKQQQLQDELVRQVLRNKMQSQQLRQVTEEFRQTVEQLQKQNEEQKQTHTKEIKDLKVENSNLASKIGHQREELKIKDGKLAELRQTKEMAANAQQENAQLRNDKALMITFLIDQSKQYQQQSKQLEAQQKRLEEVEAALQQARQAQKDAERREQEAKEAAARAEAEYQKEIKELEQQYQQQLTTATAAEKQRLQIEHQKEIDKLNQTHTEEIKELKEEEERYKLMQAGASAIMLESEQGKRDQLEEVIDQKNMELALAKYTMSNKNGEIEVKAQKIEQQQRVIDQKNMELALERHTISDKNNEIETKAQKIKEQQATIDKKDARITELEERLQAALEQHKQLQEQVEKEKAEKAAKTIKLKVGNDEFSVELSDIKLDGKELSGEKLATSFRDIFGKDKSVEVANIFGKANEYVNGLEKEENRNGLEALYGILNGLSGDNNGLKKAIQDDGKTLEAFKKLNDNLENKDKIRHNKFRIAALQQLTVVGEMQKAMEFANILGMELVKDNTVDKGVQAEENVQTKENGTQIENGTQSEDGVKTPEPSIQTITRQQAKPVVRESDKNVETPREQETPTASQDGKKMVLDVQADRVVNDKNKGNQQDSTAQKLSAQKQLTQALNNANETTQKNNPAEKSETFVYYKYIQNKEGKEEDIGLKTELGKGDVKDVTFPIELQIESKKATLGEVVAYAKSVLDSIGEKMSPENVMKMLDLQGQGIGEDQLKAAKVSIANEIKKFASEGVGLTKEKLKEEADKNQSYSQVVERIAERAEQIARIEKQKLGDRITNTVKESIMGEGYAQREKKRQEERSKQSTSLQK